MTLNTPQVGKQNQSSEDLSLLISRDEDEAAQLLWAQHKQLSEPMGGIMPISLEQSRGNRVLDVGWGVGGLVYEMATKYPSLHITGIETNASVFQKSKILVRRLDNVSIFANDIQYLQPMTHDDIGSCLDGKPPGPDCKGLYP
jgi:tRNA G46 methylase TrmB